MPGFTSPRDKRQRLMNAYKILIGNADANMYDKSDNGNLRPNSILRDFHEACHRVKNGSSAQEIADAKDVAINILIRTDAFNPVDRVDVVGFLGGVVDALAEVLSAHVNEDAAPYTVPQAGY